jgi:hypothetical protein
MATFPSTTSAYGVWKLNDVRDAEMGDNWPIVAVGRTFTISPAVSGKTTWNLDVDGPLTLSSYGDWTITPSGVFAATVKIWGAGGGMGSNDGFDTGTSYGGGGGFVGGTFNTTTSSFILRVGQGGSFTNRNTGAMVSTAAFGGGGTATNYVDGNWNCGAGGGLSGIFVTSVSQGNSVLIAGGGGGGGNYRNASSGASGGAGGGTNAQGASSGGGGGTQTAGGAGSGGASIGSSVAGSALQGGSLSSTSTMGGGGGGGYYGGGTGIYVGSNQATAGGGGSGYVNATYITSATITTGSNQTPANSGDSSRGTSGNGATTAGNSGINGKIVIT